MYTIGIDIGGTTTKIGIVDHTGKVIRKTTVVTLDYPIITDYVEALHTALQPLIDEVGGKSQIKGIGVGAPNANFYNGNIEHAPNLPWKGIVPFGKLMSDRFKLTVRITNDANAAALGEMVYGIAKGMQNFIMITLGTGVGSGIVVNGQLVYGHDGFAGELGHVTIDRTPEARLCGCGRHGCLETYASATGVAITAREMVRKATGYTLLSQMPIDEITSKNVYEAAVQGDEVALETFRFTGKILGEAFADFVAFSAPEAIVLFGGLARAGNLLMNPIRQSMEENLMPIWKGKIKLLFSQLPEDDAAIMGAASLCV